MTGAKALRLLHTSDVHIGEDYGNSVRLDSFRAVVDQALEHGVDALLIAGDLFDNARIAGELVSSTLREMARLTMPVILIPGNHDCIDRESIYRRVSFSEAGSHVHFVGEPSGRLLVFDDLGMSVWARGIEDHHPGHRPLEGYQTGSPGYWRVGLTHGHYVPTGDGVLRSSVIREEEIAGLECDYLALGHWHRFLDVSHNGVAAYYSGSPGEPGSTFASTNLVTLDPIKGVTVERIPIPMHKE